MPEKRDTKKDEFELSFDLDIDFEDELGIADLLKEVDEKPSSKQKKKSESVDTEDEDDFVKDIDYGDEDEDEDESDFDFDDEDVVRPENKEDREKLYARKLSSADNLHETLRDLVFEPVKKDVSAKDGSDSESDESVDGFELVKNKRQELYEMLDNLDATLMDKSVQDVAAVFSSLLEINNQLCMQKTDGVISIRARIFQFFTPESKSTTVSKSMRQEISLIFSPEEIQAMRSHLLNMEEDDPLKPFFAMVLDQAYDVVQYSEMTGYLMLEMASYFLNKLDKEGYGDAPKVLEFHERRQRAESSLEKAIDDLKNVETLINRHLKERPVLLELPRFLRRLIQVKLGLEDRKVIPILLHGIKERLGEYARARSAVAFDFNRVPSYQHSVRLRQSIILNLHKDILKYTGEIFEKEFLAVKEEFERSLADMEATMAEADPNSPEYKAIMKQKMMIQAKLEQQRKKLDVVKSQQRLVDVQHTMVRQAIDRYKANEATNQRLEEKLNERPKQIESNVPTNITPSKKKISRMVMAGKRRSE